MTTADEKKCTRRGPFVIIELSEKPGTVVQEPQAGAVFCETLRTANLMRDEPSWMFGPNLHFKRGSGNVINMKLIALFLGGLFLVGCTTTPVSLNSPDTNSQHDNGSRNVEMGNVTDSRPHGANWLGAIRGGFGNPLQTLETEEPVAEVVRKQFRTGLGQRGILAEDGAGEFIIEVNIKQLDSNQLMRREAHSKLDIALFKKGSRHTVYTNSVHSSNVGGGAGGGVFASIEKLEEILTRTLWETIREALDDDRLHRIIAERPTRTMSILEMEADIEALRHLRDRGVLSEDEYHERVLQIVD